MSKKGVEGIFSSNDKSIWDMNLLVCSIISFLKKIDILEIFFSYLNIIFTSAGNVLVKKLSRRFLRAFSTKTPSAYPFKPKY